MISKLLQRTIMDKEKHRRKRMTVVLPSPFASPKRSHHKTSSFVKTQRSFLKRQLFLFYSGIWQHVSLNRWWQRGYCSPLRGRDRVGNHILKTPSFFPQLSQNYRRGEEPKKKKGQAQLWRTPRCDSALIFCPRLETHFAFFPPWSVWLAQKDREMVEKGSVCLRGNVCQVQADEAFAVFPQLAPHRLSHPWRKRGTHRPVEGCVSPIADGLGKCGVQCRYEVTAPFLGAQEFGGADEASASDFLPQRGWVLVVRHPRCTGLWWISKPSLDHRHEAAYRSHPGRPAFI